ncbi:MAG: exosortase/archaeosortase family protein [Verrucomicrobiia bacterium]
MRKISLTATDRFPALALDGLKLALGMAIVGFVYYGYWVQPIGTVPCYYWLRAHWRNVSNYSHGPLIPLIALGLVWWKRTELRSSKIEPVTWGAVVVALAMFLYFLGVKGSQAHTVVASFVVLLYGLTLALAGRNVFRVLFFPITFLFLMIPLNFLDEMVGFPLRMFVAQASTALLNWLGIETVRVGTGIYSRVFRFDVADPCSGIRSLMALTTVTAAYAYVTQKSQWKRWVLFLSSMPLAVLGNMARVVSIALVAEVYGQEVAGNIYHGWSGFILFPVALAAMVILGLLLNFPYRRLWESWMKPIEQHETHE